MKVLLINGSPHKTGCTSRALKEVSNTLNKEGIDTETNDRLDRLEEHDAIDCVTAEDI